MCLWYLAVAAVLPAQSDSINQLDASGKKHGKWIVYLDKNWNTVNDSSQALFSRYTFFHHGTNLYPMGPCGGKNYTLNTASNKDNSKIKLLNGHYKWFNADGVLSSEHVLQNGEYVSCKEYYKTGELNQHFDYTQKCEGQVHGWCVFNYDKKGNLKFRSFMCPDKKGVWPKTRG